MDRNFSEFMAARWAALFRTAYLLTGDSLRAEELLQDAFARTCAKWSGIRDKGAADVYVRRILAHEASKGWRRRDKERLTDQVPDVVGADGSDLRADRLDLWREIQQLPPRMRSVLVLRYYEDLTETDTADALGISVGAVKSQAHAAIRRLRDALGTPADSALMGES